MRSTPQIFYGGPFPARFNWTYFMKCYNAKPIIFTEYFFSQLTTKVRGSKTIRYRPSSNHKRCRLGIRGRYWMTPLAPYGKLLSFTEYFKFLLQINNYSSAVASVALFPEPPASREKPPLSVYHNENPVE